MSRLKRVLIILTTVVVVIGLALGGGVLYVYSNAKVSTAGTTEFSNELAVPPLAKSTVKRDGTRLFELTMQAGQKEFRAGKPTPTWYFRGSGGRPPGDAAGGDYLGPTLRAKRGEKVEVKIKNALGEESTVHWHGMHLPAKMDGGPHQMVAPGAAWTPRWTVNQPASTLWYHPHPHGKTEKHVQRGLAGMFLLDDEKSARLALPKKYGVDDLPVIVQDVRFSGAKFDHGHKILRDTGFLGDRTMVNGTLDPYKVVGDELVRLRLLNASTARVYDFGFSDDREFALIGTDGGLLEKQARMDRIQLSPGERAEIVVRMKPGEKTVLRSFPHDSYGGGWQGRLAGGDDSFDVLELRAANALRPSPDIPGELGKLEVPDGSDSVRGRFFGLVTTGINGKGMKMDRIDETVTRGTAETWTVRNDHGTPHNFHVHDVQFRVLEVDGKQPPPELRGAKDTVFVPPHKTVKLAMRFDGPADPDTPYMYHCHLLYHEDLGMMGQFVVVEKGQRAGTVRAPHSHTGH
ncbi:multicopper oxidase family protein [Streptomyces sp. V1I1]|uniref:multicopper oxidase family protein n=1 Tax=Streptomyces sp. V1I1 TaxID=3042272 RepID=UPI0027828DA8|nr:multicopper oxidase domain-containing protein [Streptomyces sp. V1I1]MDQ0941345.1 FtsP/CotA-like multicopper oxidase with cupredoxin domain [Streptomyces sp. V1I1]